MPSDFILLNLREFLQENFLIRCKQPRSISRGFLSCIGTAHAENRVGTFNALNQYVYQFWLLKHKGCNAVRFAN